MFTPDGGRVLAGTDSGTVNVWDGKRAEATSTAVAPGEAVSQLAVSPDGSTVATGSFGTSADQPVRLWRLDGQKLVQTGQTKDTTYGFGLAFSPDGKRLVIGGLNKFAIYPLDGGETVTVQLMNDSTRSLAIAPDGRTLAAGLSSGPIRFYDLLTGKPTGNKIRQSDHATTIAFRDNSNVLVTAGGDGSFKLWDLHGRRLPRVRCCAVALPGGRCSRRSGLPPRPRPSANTPCSAGGMASDSAVKSPVVSSHAKCPSVTTGRIRSTDRFAFQCSISRLTHSDCAASGDVSNTNLILH
jgi:WD40 repeat protein